MQENTTESISRSAHAAAAFESAGVSNQAWYANTDILCLHELFELQSQFRPDATAVVLDDERLTYRQLNEQAETLGRRLCQLGVGPEVKVALCMERSPKTVIAIMAVLKAGGAYVPLDAAYPADRLAFMLRDSRARVLLTESHLLDILPRSDCEVVCVDDERLAREQDGDVGCERAIGPDNAAYLIYTSGSTGKPKGVTVTHRNVVRLFKTTAPEFQFHSDDVWTLFHSFSFDFSVWELWGALLYGGQVVIVPEDVRLLPAALVQLIHRHGVTILNQTPSAFYPFMQEAVAPNALDSSSLRLVIFGGEAIYPKRLKPWCDRFGDTCPQLVNMYGLTETTVHATIRKLNAADIYGEVGSVIGQPLADLDLYLLDAQQRPVDDSQAGEVYIAGPGLARGYLNQPTLTAERFLRNPFHVDPKARLYRTGDSARRLPGGDIEYLGRVDQQVQIRGYRVEPGEVETRLGQHPAIAQCAVISQGDEGDKYLAACFVRKPGIDVTPAALRGHLARALPAYMVPTRYVERADLPRTPSGKIDRKSIADSLSDQREMPVVTTSARTDTERRLAGIWTDVLRLERVGIDDHFFELGGHSLRATFILARVAQMFSVTLSQRCLLDAPTVRQLAARIDAVECHAETREGASLQQFNSNAPASLSVGQAAIWAALRMCPNLPIFNEPFTVQMHEPIDTAALGQALNHVAARHDALRMGFVHAHDEPKQVVHEHAPLELQVVDLRSTHADQRESRALELATADALRPFDLARPPLLRALLVQLDHADQRLYLTAHHLVVDAFAIYCVLVPELHVAYGAFRAGRAPSLPTLPIEYADFVRWQRARSASPDWEANTDYWQQQLNDATPLQLPTALRRPPMRTYRGACRTFNLSQALIDPLRVISRRADATLFMTLLAAFKTLLARDTGQDDVVVGTALAGRTRAEFEPLIGCFVNLLALRTDLSGDPTFARLLERVRNMALAAYDHQDVALVDVVRRVRPVWDPACDPLLQVVFVMEPSAPEYEFNWHVSQSDVETGTSKFDLTIALEERDGGVVGRVEYNTDLFDARPIDRMIGHYTQLLEQIGVTPDRQISALNILPAAEYDQVTRQFNRSTSAYPRDRCIQDLFEQLPTTPSGKVDREALPSLEQKGVALPQSPTRAISDLQCQLIAIWEKVLDVRPIGITDDFFELGGHSLRALRLVDEMERSLGITIGLAVLFTAPTVEAIASYVTEAHDRPSKPMAVPLQSYGSAPPLFCLHGLSYYRALAQLLGPEQPVYGIYVPTKGPLRQGEGSPQSVRPEAYVAWLAGQCLEQIRAIEPTGPYRLAGVSFGGLLAFEIAQQLHADGQQVEIVALLDSVLPSALRRSPARYLVYYLRRAGELGARRCWQRFGQSMARSWQRIRPARNGNTATDAGCLDGPADHATIQNRGHGTLIDAMRAYQLVPYPGRIILFRSTETRKKNHPFLAPDYGWRDAARGGLSVHDLPGSHLGLLEQPHVQVLAQHLRDYLGHSVLPDASPSNDRPEP